jgi:hypothetical protein
LRGVTFQPLKFIIYQVERKILLVTEKCAQL